MGLRSKTNTIMEGRILARDNLHWRTVRKYLEAPAQVPATRPRLRTLEPFNTTIAELLERDACASAAVSR